MDSSALMVTANTTSQSSDPGLPPPVASTATAATATTAVVLEHHVLSQQQDFSVVSSTSTTPTMTNCNQQVSDANGGIVQEVLVGDAQPQQAAIPQTEAHGVKTHEMDGEQFVTVIQEGQTYAIPLADYEAMIKYETVEATKSSGEMNADSSHPEESMRFLGEAGTRFEPSTKRKIVANLSLQKPFKTALRPIRVDNWGIFLLNRLQSCFQRKELCDLTLRFPDRNAQIKVHRLVVNACTDFFINAEKDGKIKDGMIDMPERFLPDAIAPIIRFMYTGKLELREELFNRLYETAMMLNMTVLTKLMDTQINTPIESEKKGKRKSYKSDDPISEAKKFKKMEEVVKLEEAKAIKLEKLKSLSRKKQEKEELEKQKLPGKKLPIWKKRVFGVSEGQRCGAVETTSTTLQPKDKLPVSDAEKTKASDLGAFRVLARTDNTGLHPIIPKASESGILPVVVTTIASDTLLQPVITSVPTPNVMTKRVQATYSRRVSPDKPKFPRKLREINEHLMFEKILRTGSKNSLMMKEAERSTSSAPAPVTADESMSSEEIKELGQEQAQRKIVEDDDDDYFDNDVEFGADDYLEGAVDSPTAAENLNTNDDQAKLDVGQQQVNQTTNSLALPEEPGLIKSQSSTTINTMVRTPQDTNNDIPVNNSEVSKTILFNIKPEPLQTSSRSREIGQAHASNNHPDLQTTKQATTSTSVLEDELGEALDEFSRVAEEEARELEQDQVDLGLKKPRRGRPPKFLQDRTSTSGNVKLERDTTSLATTAAESAAAANISTPTPSASGTSNPKTIDTDQSKLIAEFLKKHPNILKENKSVKIKISVMENGKPTMQTITLKAPKVAPDPTGVQFTPGTGIRSLDKVLYTGRRGRPKKLRDGEEDPHAEERKRIKENLLKNCPSLARQVDAAEPAKNQEPVATTEKQTLSFSSQHFQEGPLVTQFSLAGDVGQQPPQLNTLTVGQPAAIQLQPAHSSMHDPHTGMTDFGTSLVVEEGGAQYLVPQSADYIQLVEGSNAGDGKQQLVYVMDLKSAGGGGYIVPQVGNDAVLGGVLPQVQVSDGSLIMTAAPGSNGSAIVLPQGDQPTQQPHHQLLGGGGQMVVAHQPPPPQQGTEAGSGLVLQHHEAAVAGTAAIGTMMVPTAAATATFVPVTESVLPDDSSGGGPLLDAMTAAATVTVGSISTADYQQSGALPATSQGFQGIVEESSNRQPFILLPATSSIGAAPVAATAVSYVLASGGSLVQQSTTSTAAAAEPSFVQAAATTTTAANLVNKIVQDWGSDDD